MLLVWRNIWRIRRRYDFKKYDCDDCPYKKQCDRMTVLLAGISPEALLKLLETELD